jgi:hypothetical protein
MYNCAHCSSNKNIDIRYYNNKTPLFFCETGDCYENFKTFMNVDSNSNSINFNKTFYQESSKSNVQCSFCESSVFKLKFDPTAKLYFCKKTPCKYYFNNKDDALPEVSKHKVICLKKLQKCASCLLKIETKAVYQIVVPQKPSLFKNKIFCINDHCFRYYYNNVMNKNIIIHPYKKPLCDICELYNDEYNTDLYYLDYDKHDFRKKKIRKLKH